jgi:hypothetical protein
LGLEGQRRRTVQCMDLLMPRVGELIGGSMREERHHVLAEVMREKVGLSVRPSDCLFDCLPVCLSSVFCLSVCLVSVCLSVCRSVWLAGWLLDLVSMSACLPACLPAACVPEYQGVRTRSDAHAVAESELDTSRARPSDCIVRGEVMAYIADREPRAQPILTAAGKFAMPKLSLSVAVTVAYARLIIRRRYTSDGPHIHTFMDVVLSCRARNGGSLSRCHDADGPRA